MGHTSHGRQQRRRALLAIPIALVCALSAATAGTLPAYAAAAEETSIGMRFNDGLDSRLSATAFRDAARTVGYTGTSYTAGRSADNAWTDGLDSGVFALFGHSNGGIFQTDEGPSDDQDPILAAGRTQDLLPLYPNLRFFTEYLPYADVDDMRLLILAGCYTAQSGQLGNFNEVAVSRGIDSAISFSGLVMYPATTYGTSASTTNYSGNYFWSRFSYHATTGVSVSTALARARTDLVTKEGSAGGWDRYVIRGAAAAPGSVKLKPAGEGEPLNSRPVATPQFTTTAALTPVSTTTTQGPDGEPLTTVETAEGVEYRSATDGSLVDLVGTPTTSGDVRLGTEETRATAQQFVQRNVTRWDGKWELAAEEPVSHLEGDALTLMTWRTVGDDGHAGARQVTVEIDRRTGAVTYLSTAQGEAAGKASAFKVDRNEAIHAARAAIGDDRGTATAEADTWNADRWTVTVDRGLTGRPGAEIPDVERLEIDARTGDVLSRTKS
ncbi:PepSY domain-containing protein [Streptomyces flavidovirens]|uniref:PepSY domain-containing protein n=1 Tax=Streptomyces flavidovirens TaxID=67298 RepID=UPI003447D2B1